MDKALITLVLRVVDYADVLHRPSRGLCIKRTEEFGKPDQACELFEFMIQGQEAKEQAIHEFIAALERDYPTPSSSA
jgi:hypothetical protein